MSSECPSAKLCPDEMMKESASAPRQAQLPRSNHGTERTETALLSQVNSLIKLPMNLNFLSFGSCFSSSFGPNFLGYFSPHFRPKFTSVFEPPIGSIVGLTSRSILSLSTFSTLSSILTTFWLGIKISTQNLQGLTKKVFIYLLREGNRVKRAMVILRSAPFLSCFPWRQSLARNPLLLPSSWRMCQGEGEVPWLKKH